MESNIFNIDVVENIPEEKTPGTVYINGCKYDNEIPLENRIEQRHGYFTQPGPNDDVQENKRFLLIGSEKEVKDYLGLGVDKEVVAALPNNDVDMRSIFITPHHPGYTVVEPEGSRYYLDSETYKLYYAVDNPRVNGYIRISDADESSKVVKVQTLEELYEMQPSFLNMYFVVSENSIYRYNPYIEVQQDYFNVNCDVFY